MAEVIAAARAYFDGARADFAGVALDPGPQEPFAARSTPLSAASPWGETTTYGAVARALGAGPGGRRATSGRRWGATRCRCSCPATGCWPRVAGPGGFSAPGGTDAKLRMLALEGNDLAPAQAASPSETTLGLPRALVPLRASTGTSTRLTRENKSFVSKA